MALPEAGEWVDKLLVGNECLKTQPWSNPKSFTSGPIELGPGAGVSHNVDLVQVLFNMAADLSSLLTSSKNLTSHLSRPDLPLVDLSLDQVEALSRRLVSRQPGTSSDKDRA